MEGGAAIGCGENGGEDAQSTVVVGSDAVLEGLQDASLVDDR